MDATLSPAVPDPLSIAPQTGTTIVAVEFDGGVVLGADSRVSTGTYISNRASDKITALTDNVHLLRSGSAADTQLVADHVRYYVNQHSMEIPGPPSVATVANLVMQLNYQNKAALVGAMIVAGHDAGGGGQVWACPIGGTLQREKWTTDGSGSTFIWGFLDSEYREGLSKAETQALVTEAVALAMATDGSSGGCVRLVTITPEGAERTWIPGDEVPVYGAEISGGGPQGMVVA